MNRLCSAMTISLVIYYVVSTYSAACRISNRRTTTTAPAVAPPRRPHTLFRGGRARHYPRIAMPTWMDDDLDERRRRGLYRRRRRVTSPQGPHIRIGDRDYLNFSSNDYLGLAADPRMARAAGR